MIAAVRDTLADPKLDPAFVAEAMLIPTESFVGDQMLVVDPEAIRRTREALRHDLGRELLEEWRSIYAANHSNRFEYNPTAKGMRRLKSIALGYPLGRRRRRMRRPSPCASSSRPTT